MVMLRDGRRWRAAEDIALGSSRSWSEHVLCELGERTNPPAKGVTSFAARRPRSGVTLGLLAFRAYVRFLARDGRWDPILLEAMFEPQQASSGGSFAAGGGALVDFARALTEASSLHELERAFAPRFGRLMTAPMYGFYALDRDGSQIEHNVAVNVSDVFVGRYVRAMEVDPLLARSRETHRPVYNLGLMSEAEWEESEVYRAAYSVHRMHHVVEVPIVDGGRMVHQHIKRIYRAFDVDSRVALTRFLLGAPVRQHR